MTEADWLADGFVERVPFVAHAMVVSSDGLPVATSKTIGRVEAEHLAAVAAGLCSLTKGAARSFRAEPVRQIIVEMGSGFLFVSTMEESSCLAVIASVECDLGLVGYEMSLLCQQLGAVLTPALRAEAQAAMLQR